MINKGDVFPNFEYTNRVAGEFVNVNLQESIKGKKVVIFGLPGAFTPTCSTYQLPGFEELFPKFVEAGVEDIYVHSVNDPFVMNAWLEQQDIKQVKSLPDGNGDLAAQLGTLCQKANLNFGNRSWRYALVLDGDTNTVLGMFPEEGFTDNAQSDPYEASKPEAILEWVQANL